MISNPNFGWCEFQLGNFRGTPSFLTDVPIELLEAFLNYKLTGRAMVWFDEEGSEFTLLMNPYSIFIMTMWRILPLLKWRDESMHFLLFAKTPDYCKDATYKRRRHKR